MTSTSTNKTWRVNERTQGPPARRAGWSHDWQSRWSHEAGRKPLRAVPCSWQATPGLLRSPPRSHAAPPAHRECASDPGAATARGDQAEAQVSGGPARLIPPEDARAAPGRLGDSPRAPRTCPRAASGSGSRADISQPSSPSDRTVDVPSTSQRSGGPVRLSCKCGRDLNWSTAGHRVRPGRGLVITPSSLPARVDREL